MIGSDEIEKIIIGALEKLNEEFPNDKKITINNQIALLEEESEIDSISLVALIVDIESRINSNYDLELSLTDDRAMIRAESPFLNVQTLKNYILELFDEL